MNKQSELFKDAKEKYLVETKSVQLEAYTLITRLESRIENDEQMKTVIQNLADILKKKTSADTRRMISEKIKENFEKFEKNKGV